MRLFTNEISPTISFALRIVYHFGRPNYGCIVLSGPLRIVCIHVYESEGGPNIAYCLHDNGREKVFDYLFLRVLRVALLLYNMSDAATSTYPVIIVVVLAVVLS